MNAKRVNSAAGVIMAALQQNRTAAGIALSLDSAQMLMTPETAAELERLRNELAVSEQRSERRRIAWRMARTRALSTGGAADRYAARAREVQTALQDMLADLLAARIERDAALDRVSELEAERHTTNEALADITVAERSADKLTALFAPTQVLREEPDGCPRNVINGDVGDHFFKKGAFADSPVRCTYCGAKKPEPLEDPHDGPLHHLDRVGRDLPETGGAR